jgi:hypothetical protein
MDELPAESKIVPKSIATPVVNQEQAATAPTAPAAGGGLAGAIARTREVKQELEKI